MSIIEQTLKRLEEDQKRDTDKADGAKADINSPWKNNHYIAQQADDSPGLAKYVIAFISLIIVAVGAVSGLYYGYTKFITGKGGASSAKSVPMVDGLEPASKAVKAPAAIAPVKSLSDTAGSTAGEEMANSRRLAEENQKAKEAGLAEAQRIMDEARSAKEAALAEVRLIEEKTRKAREAGLAEAKQIAESNRIAAQNLKARETAVAQAKEIAKEATLAREIAVAEANRVAKENRIARETAVAQAKVIEEQKAVKAKELTANIAPLKNKTWAEESWMTNGWSELNDNGIKSALAVWETGFKTLPDNRVALVIAISDSLSKVTKTIFNIGGGHAAFIVEGKHNGEDSYYLLSAPPPDLLRDEKNVIGNILGRNSILGNSKRKLLARMNPVAKTMATAKGEVRAKGVTLAEQSGGMPEDPAVLINRGRHQVRVGSYKEAVNTLMPVFDSDNVGWEAYFLIGTAYLGSGNLELSEKYLELGLAIDGRRSGLWLQRAIVAQQKNDHDKALETLYYLKTISPKMPEVYLNIGYSSDVLGKRKKAKEAYQSFLDLTENNHAYLDIRKQVLKRILN